MSYEQSIINKLEPTYKLLYADYRDNLDERPELIQECLSAKCLDPIHEEIMEWNLFDAEMESIDYILRELPLTDEEREWLEEWDNRQLIEEEIQNRDNSTYIKDVIKNTDDMPVRLHLFSNYDCMNSDYSMTPYQYDWYFKDMIDALNLNPRKVAERLWDKADDLSNYPDMPERDGNEYISYDDLAVELANSCGSCNLLTFVWLLDVSDIKDGITTVTIPKWNCCGLFDKDTGSWSLIECKLLRDFTVKLSTPIEWKTQHDTYELYIDRGGIWYSIGEVYWPTRQFFWATVSLF